MGTTQRSYWAARLLAFATTLLLLGSIDVQLPVVGIALGAVHLARARMPASDHGRTEGAGRGRKAHLMMLSAGALVVLVAVLAVNALPGPAQGPGEHGAGPRETSTYEGVEYCLKCHGPGGTGGDQYTGWRATAHGADFTNRTYHGVPTDLFARPDGECLPCHVVGYNQTDIGGFDPSLDWASGNNSMLLGVQCENCHGPGSDLCEECHGPPIDHSHQATNMVEKPSPEQSCSGGFSGAACHGPGGRDVYTSWAHSNHSPADQREKASPQGLNTYCARCKSPAQYDPGTTLSNATAIPMEKWRGVECADCHDSHGNRFKGQLKAPPDEVCGGCHNSEYAVAAPGEAPLHPQKEMFLGRLGANVTGTKGMPGTTCAGCHGWNTPGVAPGVNLSDIPGYPYPMHERHLFTATPESCADCHSDLLLSMPNVTRPADSQGANATAWAAWDKWMPRWLGEVGKWNATVRDWQSETMALMEVVGPEVAAAGAAIESARENGTKDAAALAGAAALWGDAYWNYHLVVNDQSDGVHNHDFAMALLDDARAKAERALGLILANSAPLADAGPFRTVNSGETVAFDASGSRDPDGTILSYIWDFGDGNGSAGRAAVHAYSESGLYMVTLTVADDLGADDSATTYVLVNAVMAGNIPPVALAGDDRTTAPGARASFDGSASFDPDGTIASYSWSFGDGTCATGATAEHAYADAGAYAVVLIVTDDRGASGFDLAIVSVQAPGPTPVDLTPLNDALAALEAELGNSTLSIRSIQEDIDSLKKAASSTKEEASDARRSVDVLSGSLGMNTAVALAIVFIMASVLHVATAARIRALSRELDALARGRAGGPGGKTTPAPNDESEDE